jgi:hypothetical protein
MYVMSINTQYVYMYPLIASPHTEACRDVIGRIPHQSKGVKQHTHAHSYTHTHTYTHIHSYYIQPHDVTSKDIPFEEAEVMQYGDGITRPCIIRAAKKPLSVNNRKTRIKISVVTHDR